MIKILFVCHGNICRSPMAELVMKQLVRYLLPKLQEFYQREEGKRELRNGKRISQRILPVDFML